MRICEANTRILRAIYQPNMDAMFIEFQLAMPRTNASPKPRRIELSAGRGRKENALATQTGTRFPDGSPGGKHVPEFTLRLGRSFRMTHSSGRRVPESKLEMGFIFLMTGLAENETRNLL